MTASIRYQILNAIAGDPLGTDEIELETTLTRSQIQTNMSLAIKDGMATRQNDDGALIYHITAKGRQYLAANGATEQASSAQPAVAGNTGSSGSETPPNTSSTEAAAHEFEIPAFLRKATEPPQDSITPAIDAQVPEHVTELQHALDTITTLSMQLKHWQQPENWPVAQMLAALQAMLECDTGLLISHHGISVMHGDDEYAVANPSEVLYTLDAIIHLEKRKVA